VPAVISIQFAEDEAVHAHSRATDTVTCPVPPVGAKLDDELEMVAWQRADVGPVTDVVAELPQANDPTATPIENSRGLTRNFTTDVHTTLAPARIEA
jgi:hypothetical protein